MKNLLFLALTLCSSGVLCAAEQRPNIVFFFADDQTTNTLGCYGNTIIKTPHIDRLASEGVRFTNATVSHSICWVSRTTILTGMTGRGYGIPGRRDAARPEAVEELVSDILRKSGYRVGYFGKWHAHMPKGFKQTDHFDVYKSVGRNPYFKKQPDGSLRHETEIIVDHGIDFVRSQPADKPFLLNMWFNAGHAEDGDHRPGIGHFPWPKATDGMYEDVVIPPPRLSEAEFFDDLPEFLQTTINRERYYWRWDTPEKYQTNIRAYYRMISGIDGAIGRFMEALDAAGLADNTIIVYSADNGYYMGNRGLAGKWSHYEESLRVPMIVYDPRPNSGPKGKTVSQPVTNVDLPATFLAWAGVPVPERYQGYAFDGLVRGETISNFPTERFHEHFAVRHRIPAFEGIRNEQFKYVRYVDHGNTEFLHDLKADPDERVNLASDPAHQKTLEAMRTRTDLRVKELGGPLLPLNKKFTPSTKPYQTPGKK